ncbi:DMT family transporter [Actinomycetospora sp. CA-053990]|uniref:DMT family transporter n=1 Tax=Actinomycetospora sp. CA-053990 TaxID=3239891 RepID=UPI003D94BD7D
MILPLGLAVLAAVLNAAGDLLQRRSMRTEPGGHRGPLRLLARVTRRPGWLAGVGVSLVGLCVHVVALSTGTIATVQPLLVLEFPVAVLGASLLFGVRLSRRDGAAVAIMTLGVAAVVLCPAPGGGDPMAVPGATWGLGLGVLAVLVAVLAVAGVLTRGNRRAALLGTAAGVGYGMTAALLSAAGTTTRHGLTAPVGAWQTYLALVVGTAAFALLQSALHAGLLVASEPGLTLANPLVGVSWGVLVFGEHVRAGLWLVGTAAGAVLLAVGTVLLSRSPVLELRQGRSPAPRTEESEESEDSEDAVAAA